MKVLKGYVCSMARPKGLMAKSYVLEETLGFVTEYFQEFEHVFKRAWDVKKEEGVSGEVLEGAPTKFVFSPILQDLAHDYVLTNTKIMGPWI